MLEAQIAQGVQLLDLMLEYFADDGTGRAAVMMTELAGTALWALFSI